MRPQVINQHYIPKSYLKNFGFLVNAKKKKWSLYATENGGDIIKRSTENICSVDYLYDLPFVDGEEKQFLEHAYEEHADRHFNSIVEFISNDSNVLLPGMMREKIVKACLSLYYRTPKFVELDENAIQEINLLPEVEREKAWKIKKTELLQDSVKKFEELYIEKKNCGISVNKAVGDIEFISGDNPVVIRNGSNVLVDVLSSENFIHIPLTPRYSISLIPSKETELNNTFYRIEYSDDFVIATNYDIERLHQQFLLGTENSLKVYIENSAEYKRPVSPNHPKVLALRDQSIAMSFLIQILAENKGVITLELERFFDFCWDEIPGFKENPNAISMREEIKEALR